MSKPELEIIEKDDNHVIYLLSQDISGLDLYEKSKVIQRFKTSEAKIMENVIESTLKDFFKQVGINIKSTQKSVLNEAFATLKSKGMRLIVVDRNENATFEKFVGTSNNHMTIIEEDNCIDIAMEVRFMPIEEILYEKLCRGCPKEKQCHDNCEHCNKYLEQLDKELDDEVYAHD